MRSVLHTLDYLRIFRKDVRYPVRLEMCCTVSRSGEVFSGTIIDFSRRGCRAIIPELTSLQLVVVTTISFPLGEETYSIPVPANHIWARNINGVFQHGFQFRDFELTDHTVFLEFIVKGNK